MVVGRHAVRYCIGASLAALAAVAVAATAFIAAGCAVCSLLVVVLAVALVGWFVCVCVSIVCCLFAVGCCYLCVCGLLLHWSDCNCGDDAVADDVHGRSI